MPLRPEALTVPRASPDRGAVDGKAPPDQHASNLPHHSIGRCCPPPRSRRIGSLLRKGRHSADRVTGGSRGVLVRRSSRTFYTASIQQCPSGKSICCSMSWMRTGTERSVSQGLVLFGLLAAICCPSLTAALQRVVIVADSHEFLYLADLLNRRMRKVPLSIVLSISFLLT